MYVQKHFAVTDQKELIHFIKVNAFGQLISTVDNRLFSTHIPFYLMEDGKSLTCHLAKSNPQWNTIEGQEILVTFQGVHDYVSPSWYESPGVPTWNYQAVHVYGTAELVTDLEELRVLVNTITEKYESAVPEPWKPDYKESLLSVIVGIRISIDEIQGKYKLSQNRPEVDKKRVIEKLCEKGSLALSDVMRKNL